MWFVFSLRNTHQSCVMRYLHMQTQYTVRTLCQSVYKDIYIQSERERERDLAGRIKCSNKSILIVCIMTKLVHPNTMFSINVQSNKGTLGLTILGSTLVFVISVDEKLEGHKKFSLVIQHIIQCIVPPVGIIALSAIHFPSSEASEHIFFNEIYFPHPPPKI